jgi:hypothetical protein
MGVGRSNAVLWEEVGGARNAITTGLGDIVEIATVMIFGWSEEPSIKVAQGPESAGFCVFVNDGFRAGRCHGVPIPIIRASKFFVCGNVGFDSGSSE